MTEGPGTFCDLCGEHHGPGLLARVCIGGEWVWECIDCREMRETIRPATPR